MEISSSVTKYDIYTGTSQFCIIISSMPVSVNHELFSRPSSTAKGFRKDASSPNSSCIRSN